MEKTKDHNLLPKLIISGLILLILCGLSFWGGISYQKGHTTNATAQGGTTAGAFGGRFRGGARPTIGTVSTVSSSSLVVQTQDGTTKTFTLTSTTEVTDNGASSSVSNIQSGDTVAVIVSTSNTNQATLVLLNPNFGGGFGGGQPSGSSPDSTAAPTNTQTN